MEVNVDMLEQMDMLDLSDQDTVDVFLSCGAEDNNNVATLLPGMYNFHNYPHQLLAPVFHLGYVMVKLFVQGKGWKFNQVCGHMQFINRSSMGINGRN